MSIYASEVAWTAEYDPYLDVPAEVREASAFRFGVERIEQPKPAPKHRKPKRKSDRLLITAVLLIGVVGIGVGAAGTYEYGPTLQHMSTPKPVHVTWPVRSRTTHLREV